ncbi:MAG: 1-phosphofructokinase family hexose kinase [Acidobacteriota bacterium]
MILTLTINPAIDRTMLVDKLVFEDRGYILSRSEAAGGRGVNASQVIHSFGGKTLALLTSGGEVGKRMEKSLSGMGFPYEAVKVQAESRVNLTISDSQGLTIKLNEKGAEIRAAEVQAIRDLVKARLGKATWLMLCGSIQPGVPTDLYREFVVLAKQQGVRTLLDTDGDALLQAIEARPSFSSPNQQEAERLLGRAILTRSQSLEAVTRLHAMGPESVILSLGSRGALGAFPEGIFEAIPPRVEAISPIGAGDALAAAFVWALEKKKTLPDALRWGVATGTASAMLPGTNFPTLEQTKAIYKKVEVRQVT